MTVRTRALAWSGGLCVLLVAVVLASAGVGPVSIPPVTVAKAVLGALVPSLGYAVERTVRVIVVDVRLPRILLAALVGFALATAGVVMQGFFRNPMADPSIIGISSGAAVGAVASIVFPFVLPFGLQLQGAAFVTSVLTGFGVYLLATRDGHTPTATLLLAGVAVQTFLGAVISFMMLESGWSLQRVVFWLMGHLSGTTWREVSVVAAVLPPLFLLLLFYASDMNVLLLGEADAHSLGIEVERTKRILLAVSSVVTAAAVAVSGVIGFVGLIVPHAMRLLVGPDHRILLPTSALAGASFLVATDTLARSGAAEVPVGIVTAAIGAPFFLYLLRTREVHRL
ncbi:vitamin B12 ABC transporter permease BtuC [Halogeometricum luteum]|uniref:Vitamin B12 ABC transporter permease BtuC n=1 Tax=Halogeometricum luteum TaxID=2950537 RepID=A0ABU2FXY0_9EURY|nr:vitamin B12 ABC transporter permease BtuC [Halogeometricum sp. S3BR5-2]MDS0293381.1 vitamin B12 ABC transporter permease BtuC [Halogeometricum sp. S3BR5-2]